MGATSFLACFKGQIGVSKGFFMSIMGVNFNLKLQHWHVNVQVLPQSRFRNRSPRNVFGIGSHLTFISVLNFQWLSCCSIHQKPPSHCILRGESFGADNSHNACLPALEREVITVYHFIFTQYVTLMHRLQNILSNAEESVIDRNTSVSVFLWENLHCMYKVAIYCAPAEEEDAMLT